VTNLKRAGDRQRRGRRVDQDFGTETEKSCNDYLNLHLKKLIKKVWLFKKIDFTLLKALLK